MLTLIHSQSQQTTLGKSNSLTSLENLIHFLSILTLVKRNLDQFFDIQNLVIFFFSEILELHTIGSDINRLQIYF